MCVVRPYNSPLSYYTYVLCTCFQNKSTIKFYNPIHFLQLDEIKLNSILEIINYRLFRDSVFP